MHCHATREERFIIECLVLTLKIGAVIVGFGFVSSFLITDLQEDKENQKRYLRVLLESIVFHGKELNSRVSIV